MSAVNSTMLPLGSSAPDFTLPEPAAGNRPVSLARLAEGAECVLIAFLANHCPYVKHMIAPLAGLIREYKPRGLKAAGISASDVNAYPEDAPLEMAALSRKLRFAFPYLYDRSQGAAKAFRAACTPDLFLFDAGLRLAYRGQFDDSRPGNNARATGKDLREAVEALLRGETPSPDQKPSLGCSIKWRPGNEPDYFSNPEKGDG